MGIPVFSTALIGLRSFATRQFLRQLAYANVKFRMQIVEIINIPFRIRTAMMRSLERKNSHFAFLSTMAFSYLRYDILAPYGLSGWHFVSLSLHRSTFVNKCMISTPDYCNAVDRKLILDRCIQLSLIDVLLQLLLFIVYLYMKSMKRIICVSMNAI